MQNKLKIVTSVYETQYEGTRGGYKTFPLCTHTIRNMLFEPYEYVIYTDKNTYDNNEMGTLFDLPNITIKFQELNSDFYLNVLDPIRQKAFDEWERIYCVKNYIEIILNKLKHLLDESSDSHNTIWMDAGLFGTSCHDGWRDYMFDLTKKDDILLKKVNEKIDQYDFIAIRGTGICVNYHIKGNVCSYFGLDNFSLVPACLFGGKRKNIIELFSNYVEEYVSYIKKYEHLISEQDLISGILHQKPELVKFFDFEDWLDLQKGLLKIMDLYDEEKYVMTLDYDRSAIQL